MVSSSKQPADPRAKGPTQAGPAEKKKRRCGKGQKGWGSAEEAEASGWRGELEVSLGPGSLRGRGTGLSSSDWSASQEGTLTF